MKQKLTAMLLVLACWAAAAQPVSTVVTCPGEDASHSMRIGWAAPATGYYVKYSAVGNEGNTVTLRPETEFRCTTFAGVNSKAADGSDVVEQAVITKCGATLKNLQPNTRYSYVIWARWSWPRRPRSWAWMPFMTLCMRWLRTKPVTAALWRAC